MLVVVEEPVFESHGPFPQMSTRSGQGTAAIAGHPPHLPKRRLRLLDGPEVCGGNMGRVPYESTAGSRGPWASSMQPPRIQTAEVTPLKYDSHVQLCTDITTVELGVFLQREDS